jgi:hypothetical protein
MEAYAVVGKVDSQFASHDWAKKMSRTMLTRMTFPPSGQIPQPIFTSKIITTRSIFTEAGPPSTKRLKNINQQGYGIL